MFTIRLSLAAWLFCHCASLSCAIAIGPMINDGNDSSIWDSHSVLCAHVRDVRPQGKNVFQVQFSPHFTLSGRFDAGRFDAIEATMQCGGNELVPEPPRVGDLVVVVLRESPARTGLQDSKRYEVTRDCWGFMPPQGHALVNLDGFQDKRLLQIIEKVKAARQNRNHEQDFWRFPSPPTRSDGKKPLQAAR